MASSHASAEHEVVERTGEGERGNAMLEAQLRKRWNAAFETFRSRKDEERRRETSRFIAYGTKTLRELTLVALILGDLLGDVLDLEQQLDTLNRRYGGFRDSGGNTTGDEVLGERHGIRETRHFVCVCGWCEKSKTG